jgi:DNA-binding transcriptional LysR family regulator
MHQRHSSPDLNLLEALDALLNELNVTRAAARLGISQSAMSHKLARLREFFGDPLLVGGRGGMVPTPQAERIGRTIRQPFIDLRAAMQDTAPFDPATSTRRFVMVSPDYAAFSFWPRARTMMAEEGPTTSLVVREPWKGMLDALRDGTLDLIAGVDLEPVAGLIRTKLFQDSLVCIVRSDHPRVGKVLDLETFAAEPHLLVTRDPDGKGPLDAALASHGLRRHIAMRVPYHLAAPFIVARSDLIALTTLALARDAASLLPLRILRCPIALPLLKVTMAWHERNQNDPAHQWFREITIRCAAGVHDGTLDDDEAPVAATRSRARSAASASRRKPRQRPTPTRARSE